jgi:oligopeptidase A
VSGTDTVTLKKMPPANDLNPLLSPEFRVPFDRIRAEHVAPATEELLRGARQRLEEVAAAGGPRTFVNTLRSLDDLAEPLEYAIGVVRHLESVATYPELRAAYSAAQPQVSAFYSGIPLHAGLWRAVQDFAATEEAARLEGERRRLLTKTIDNFRRHGANLDPAGKQRLEALDVELSKLTIKFAENVLDSTNAFELVITDTAGLAGLPPSALAAARESAARKGREGWRFTLHAPDYFAVMTYLDDAAVRRQVYEAFSVRATEGGLDNRPLIARILELRSERARLLGYANFADLVLEDRMAHDGARALAFLDDLKVKTEARFREENRELLEFRRSLEGPAAAELAGWDVAYYAEKQRAALYDFDEEALRPYFPLEQAVAGLFDLAHRLYGLRIEQEAGAPVWDEAVRYYNVHDESGEFLGGFYADWFPRENKRGGAWMDALITGGPEGAKFRPHLGLVCGNLTPPVGGKPALLTHREVETIFHEFGHLLHHLLSRVECRGLAGTNVAWDFVELPSQIMENCAGNANRSICSRVIGDRPAGARRFVSEDEAGAHLSRRQPADAAARVQLYRPAAARAVLTRARWRRGGLRAPHSAGVQPRAAAARPRDARGLHAFVREPGGLWRWVLLLQVGRGLGGRCVHTLPRAWDLQPRSRG